MPSHPWINAPHFSFWLASLLASRGSLWGLSWSCSYLKAPPLFMLLVTSPFTCLDTSVLYLEACLSAMAWIVFYGGTGTKRQEAGPVCPFKDHSGHNISYTMFYQPDKIWRDRVHLSVEALACVHRAGRDSKHLNFSFPMLHFAFLLNLAPPDFSIFIY